MQGTEVLDDESYAAIARTSLAVTRFANMPRMIGCSEKEAIA
jgi:hypothetical protein